METATKERLTGALLVVLALVIVIPELLSGRDSTEQGTPPAQNPEEGAPLQTYDVQLDGSGAAPVAPRDMPAAAAAEIAAVPPPVTSSEVAAAPAAAPGPAVAAASTPAEPAATATPPPSKAVAPETPLAVKPASNSTNAATPPQPAKEAATSSAAKASTPASREPASAATGKWWVQLGSFASRDNAQQLARKLHAAGFNMDVSQSRSKGKELFRVRAGPVADRDAASALQRRLAAAGEKNSSLVAP